VKFNNTPEATVYDNIRNKLGHDTEEYFKVGFTRVYIHGTSPEEQEFIRIFCKKVLPYFWKTQE